MEGFTVFNQRRKNTSLTGANDKVRAWHQLQPIPVVVNRYDTLDNLHEAPEESYNLYKSSKVAKTKNRKKYLPKSNKERIVIIGDSHAKRYAAELSTELGKTLR